MSDRYRGEKVTPIRHDIDPGKKQGQDGGDEGGSMEARIAVLEYQVGRIEKDVSELKEDVKETRKEMNAGFISVRDKMDTNLKWLVTLGIAAVATLAGIMAKGFHWIGT